MTTETSGPNTKVARVIREYDLDDIGSTLEDAWTGEAGERTSLRDLADEFNEAVLEAALRDIDASPLSVEVSSMYKALRNGSKSSATRARRRLKREGIDVDKLTGDFVTHQAVYTYLTEVRGASLPAADEEMIDRKIDTIEKLQGRVSAVTESAISSLANAEELDCGDYDVLVDVRAVCPNCGTDTTVSELLRRGGCDCTVKPDSTDNS
ncbi:rod-determining factor RdfA [Halorubrum rutilum]|uniref:Rod-determining factor RdfA n=1 Tax=Halorubrum rutilum TaxID=1364933 RepID=A0ABD6AIK6_9EURY|nr:rod-determining factor RdfA [Halorubrum rutilum]